MSIHKKGTRQQQEHAELISLRKFARFTKDWVEEKLEYGKPVDPLELRNDLDRLANFDLDPVPPITNDDVPGQILIDGTEAGS